MTYKRRPWVPGAIFHITARGNHRNDIFRDGEDFQVYITFLQGALEHFKGKFEIYCYCLMDNHIHLLIKSYELHISNLISRVKHSHSYPANFMLISAMNPCSCGYYGENRCHCTDYEVMKYRSRISGPILDRIDMQKYVQPVNFMELSNY